MTELSKRRFGRREWVGEAEADLTPKFRLMPFKFVFLIVVAMDVGSALATLLALG